MLDNFNKTVLLVASVLLIFGLIIIGLFSIKSIESSAYPPIISDCPDYWNVSYDAQKNKICQQDSINTGIVPDTANRCVAYPVSLFSANGSSVNDIICEKNNWAKSCNIHWDGITNNSTACIKTTI